MKNQAVDLVMGSLSDSSKKVYGRALNQFCSFMNDKKVKPIPCPTHILVDFILHQYNLGYAQTSITSQLSAINFIHRLANYPPPSDSFLVRKIMIGMSKQTYKPDIRLPITPNILLLMTRSLEVCFKNDYFLVSLLKAMFTLAFHAFLRIGEICTSVVPNTIKVTDVSRCGSSYKIRMVNYKHAPINHSTILEVQKNDSEICPVQHLSSYLKIRPNVSGPLFLFRDGKPISKRFFSNCLQRCLESTGLNTKRYKSHSFRIGAATHAASLGISDDRIMRMGRWHSKAFMKYIRLPSINT